MYVFGGRTGLTSWSNELSAFDVEGMSWSKIPLEPQQSLIHAPALIGHTMNKVGNNLYVFGGRSGLFSYNGHLYKIDPIKETIVQMNTTTLSKGPSARQGHSAVALNDKQLWIHGGNDGDSALDDTYILDVNTMTWKQVKSSGTKTEGHKSVLVEKDSQTFIYVFGGYSGSAGFVSDIRIYDVAKDTWSVLPKGKPRSFHTAVRVGSNVYLFGGLNSDNVIASTHVFSVVVDEWIEGSWVGPEPSPRQGHCAVAYGTDIYLFGGAKDWYSTYNDLWKLDTLKQSSPSNVKTTDETIDQTLTRAALTFAEDQKPALSSDINQSIEQEVSAILEQEKQYENLFKQIPEFINRCRRIEALNKNMQSLKDSFTAVSNNISVYLSDITTANSEFKKYKELVQKEEAELRAKAVALKNAENDLNEQRANTRSLIQRIEEHKSKVRTIEEECHIYEHDVKNYEQKKRSLSLEHKRLADRYKELGQSLGHEEENAKKLELEKQTKTTDLENTRKERDQLKKKMDDKIHELNTLTSQLNTAEDTLKQWRQKFSEVSVLKTDLQNVIDAEKRYTMTKAKFLSVLNDLSSKLTSLDAERKSLEGKEADLNRLDSFFKEQEKNLSALVKEKEDAIKQVKSELSALQAKYRAVTENEQKIQKELDRITSYLGNAKSTRESAERDRMIIKTDLDNMETKENNTIAELEKAKKNLEECKIKLNNETAILKNIESHLSAQQQKETQALKKKNEIEAEVRDKHGRLKTNLDRAAYYKEKLISTRQNLYAIRIDFEARRKDLVDFRKEMETKLLTAGPSSEVVKACEKENNALKQEVAKLKEQVAALNKEVETLRKQRVPPITPDVLKA